MGNGGVEKQLRIGDGGRRLRDLRGDHGGDGHGFVAAGTGGQEQRAGCGESEVPASYQILTRAFLPPVQYTVSPPEQVMR